MMDTIPEIKTKPVNGRMHQLFSHPARKILNVYCTAGFPDLDSTRIVLKSLQESGTDVIELGMPYSDPLADGPVIQASSTIALKNGMTIPRLFEQLKGFREEISVPVILMGYLNPILQFGFEKFCSQAASVGIDGLIIPDIPMFEYLKEYREVIEKKGLNFIFLVTPETSDERILQLDALSSGFLYAVSSSSITGSDKNFEEVISYLKRLKKLNLKNPVLVGFGIRDKKTFDTACSVADGAIIGTAYIKAIEAGDVERKTREFVRGIREGDRD